MNQRSFPFPDLTVDDAPPEARPALRGTAARIGLVPAAMARQAIAPAVAATFGKMLAAWGATSFDAIEREVVTFAVARHTGMVRAPIDPPLAAFAPGPPPA